jgi:hypothetical protein
MKFELNTSSIKYFASYIAWLSVAQASLTMYIYLFDLQDLYKILMHSTA